MASDLKERAMVALVERAAHLGDAGLLVLRGGLVMRELIAPIRRPVDDVDFLALCDEEKGAELLRSIVSAGADALGFRLESLTRIWEETEFPGLRGIVAVESDGEGLEVQVDVGFGDPRAAAESGLRLNGMSVDIAAAALETMLAWKIHGMFERGEGKWRAKDLVDVRDLLDRCSDRKSAVRCLRVAFESRHDDFEICARFVHGEWGMSRGSRRKWRQFRRVRMAFDAQRELPEDLQDLVASLRRDLAPLIKAASGQ